MFHKVISATPTSNYNLIVQFSEGTTKKYKVDALFNRIPAFTVFIEKPLDFYHVQVDTGGYGISWSDDLDLSSDELWTNGKIIETPYDGLLSFKDASDI